MKNMLFACKISILVAKLVCTLLGRWTIMRTRISAANRWKGTIQIRFSHDGSIIIMGIKVTYDRTIPTKLMDVQPIWLLGS